MKLNNKKIIEYASVGIYFLYFLLRIIFEVTQNTVIDYTTDIIGILGGILIVMFTLYLSINSHENKDRKKAFKYVLLGALIIFISGARLYR